MTRRQFRHYKMALIFPTLTAKPMHVDKRRPSHDPVTVVLAYAYADEPELLARQRGLHHLNLTHIHHHRFRLVWNLPKPVHKLLTNSHLVYF